jgi:WD40 repeat protein
MILPSKECLIINSQENKEFFLFDPKTTAVLHKYRDDCHLSNLAYYPRSQQILGQQNNKTFVNVWSYDSQEAEIRISMNETMMVLQVSKDSHYLIGGGITGNVYFWELPNGILIKKKMVHST